MIIQFKQVAAAAGYDGDSIRYAAYTNLDQPASFGDWMKAMKTNQNNVAQTMTQLLRGVPYSAFRFEVPGVSSKALDKPFEFVVYDDRYLVEFGAKQDPDAFAQHLRCESGHETDNNNKL